VCATQVRPMRVCPFAFRYQGNGATPCQYIDTNILLSVIELLFLSLSFDALQGKMCQNSLPSGGGRSLGAKISGEGVVPLPIY